MGTGRFDPDDYVSYSTAKHGTADRSTLRSKSSASMFASRTIDPTMDPKLAKAGRRESRDSADNPLSTPIMLWTDVTGSMGHLSQEVLTGMETVCTALYDRKPVTDPHILTGAIGDTFHDQYPVQMSQFEADLRIVKETEKLYIERGGGGNNGESYATAWLVAGMMTSTDAWDKRGEKGYLFTVGDEPLLGHTALHAGPAITVDQAKRFLDIDLQSDLTAEECYALASDRWEIFHVCVNRNYESAVKRSFGALLGERLLWLQDTAILPELIVSAIQVAAGENIRTVADSWGGDKSVALASALSGLPSVGTSGSGGVARL